DLRLHAWAARWDDGRQLCQADDARGHSRAPRRTLGVVDDRGWTVALVRRRLRGLHRARRLVQRGARQPCPAGGHRRGLARNTTMVLRRRLSGRGRWAWWFLGRAAQGATAGSPLVSRRSGSVASALCRLDRVPSTTRAVGTASSSIRPENSVPKPSAMAMGTRKSAWGSVSRIIGISP